MSPVFSRTSPRSCGLALALAGTLLAGCTDEPLTTDDPGPASPFAGDQRLEGMLASGALKIDVSAAAADDPTVVADARDLAARTLEQVGGLDLAARHKVAIRFLRKGRVGGEPDGNAVDRAAAKAAVGAAGAAALTGFDAFNPATRNEFRIELAGGALEAVGRSASARGLDTGSAPGREVPISFSWSNGDDDRYRPYGINAAVTNTAHRMLVRLGSGCSGTLVGPRHIVTAGHCLYNRDTDTWSDDFTARAGRNGSSSVASVLVDNDNIPGGQVLWYFTPAQYRAETGSTWGYDFGTPRRARPHRRHRRLDGPRLVLERVARCSDDPPPRLPGLRSRDAHRPSRRTASRTTSTRTRPPASSASTSRRTRAAGAASSTTRATPPRATAALRCTSITTTSRA